MKKLALAIALTGLVGTYTLASNIEIINVEIEGEHDSKKCKDKDCKKCKDASKKSCTTEKTANGKSCSTKTEGKSCNSKTGATKSCCSKKK